MMGQPTLAHLYDRHAPGMRRYAVRILGPGDAGVDDAVQDVFTRAHRVEIADRLEPGAAAAWLYTSVRYRCLDALRARGRTTALDEDHPALESVAEAVTQRLHLREVVDLVHELPPRQREAMVLSTLGGHSYQEIAEELDVSLGAVKALINRARTGLHQARLAA